MAGSPTTAFSDFVDLTGPTTLTSPDVFINDAVKNTNLIRRFMKGKDLHEVCQGGDKIQDFVMFDESATFEFYQTNADFTPRNPQVMTQWEVDWRFAKDEMAWTKQEVVLNSPVGAGKNYLKEAYKRLWNKIQARMWTSYWKGIEDQLWKLPNASSMEAASGIEPYSIPAFINEFGRDITNGIDVAGAGHYDAAMTETGTWTTVQTIDPAAVGKTKWQNLVHTYAENPPTGQNDDWDLWDALNSCYLRAEFEPLPDHEQYSEPKSRPQFIATDLQGYTNYQTGLRAAQNVFRQATNDPHYGTMLYAGMEMVYVSTLDSAALYYDASDDPVTQANANSGGAGVSGAGPRYYGINGTYQLPVWHSSVYADMTETMSHPRQPFSYVKYVDTWYNLVCRSRQRQFLVTPAAGGLS